MPNGLNRLLSVAKTIADTDIAAAKTRAEQLERAQAAATKPKDPDPKPAELRVEPDKPPETGGKKDVRTETATEAEEVQPEANTVIPVAEAETHYARALKGFDREIRHSHPTLRWLKEEERNWRHMIIRMAGDYWLGQHYREHGRVDFPGHVWREIATLAGAVVNSLIVGTTLPSPKTLLTALDASYEKFDQLIAPYRGTPRQSTSEEKEEDEPETPTEPVEEDVDQARLEYAAGNMAAALFGDPAEWPKINPQLAIKADRKLTEAGLTGDAHATELQLGVTQIWEMASNWLDYYLRVEKLPLLRKALVAKNDEHYGVVYDTAAVVTANHLSWDTTDDGKPSPAQAYVDSLFDRGDLDEAITDL
jgi:hypothetical protein